MKIYFDIMKKGDIMKIYFIKYKVILIEWKCIFISYELFYFCNISATITLTTIAFDPEPCHILLLNFS